MPSQAGVTTSVAIPYKARLISSVRNEELHHVHPANDFFHLQFFC